MKTKVHESEPLSWRKGVTLSTADIWPSDHLPDHLLRATPRVSKNKGGGAKAQGVKQVNKMMPHPIRVCASASGGPSTRSPDADLSGHHGSVGALADVTHGAASVGHGGSQPPSQEPVTKMGGNWQG